jgi:hypothetical protein
MGVKELQGVGTIFSMSGILDRRNDAQPSRHDADQQRVIIYEECAH